MFSRTKNNLDECDVVFVGWRKEGSNQSINQKRIRVTKVTNVTARPQ